MSANSSGHHSDLNIVAVHEAIAASVPERECIVWRDRRLTWRDVTDRTPAVRATRCSTAGIGGAPRAGRRRMGEPARPRRAAPDQRQRVPRGDARRVEGAGRRVNVNYRYTADELAFVLGDSAAVAVVYHARFAPVVADGTRPMPDRTAARGRRRRIRHASRSPGRSTTKTSSARLADTRPRARMVAGRPLRGLHRRHHRRPQGRAVAPGRLPRHRPRHHRRSPTRSSTGPPEPDRPTRPAGPPVHARRGPLERDLVLARRGHRRHPGRHRTPRPGRRRSTRANASRSDRCSSSATRSPVRSLDELERRPS